MREKQKYVGILAVHGSKEEHAHHMQSLGYGIQMIKNPEDLENLSGIIFPGGESTSFGRLIQWSSLLDPLIQKISTEQIPVFGTCAGAILLSSQGSEFGMNLLDISVERNAYGSQVESFSEEVFIDAIDDWFHCIFIRAPKISRIGKDISILASYNKSPILIEHTQKNILAATFHPELSESLAIHQYFSQMIEKWAS